MATYRLLSNLTWRLLMTKIVPSKIFKNVIGAKPFSEMHCFIDDREVPIRECRLELAEKSEIANFYFWEKECEEHPTNAHCKMFET